MYTSSGGIYDDDIESLKNMLHVLDDQLERLEQSAAKCPDPDSFGIYDRGEDTIGIGFVACQKYVAATYGWLKCPKEKALPVGPRHQSGIYIAEIVSHAANFWKHHDEWEIEGKPNNKTVSAIEKLGLRITADYLLSNVLASIVNSQPCRLAPVVPLLEMWREALRANAVGESKQGHSS